MSHILLSTVSSLTKRRQLILWFVLIALLLLKYFWSLFLFPGVPFGYDAGIYRYLFLKHAEGWPLFMIAGMPEWARVHALGLFAFTTPFIKLGLPVDWLIGWMWNLFPVMLAGVLAWVVGKRQGVTIAVAVGIAALLSTVQYEGFLMIYQKVFVALLWCTLSFHFLDRRSRWWIVFGMLTIATHQQIGLIFVLAILASVIGGWVAQSAKRGLFIEWIIACVLGLLWYLPTYQRSVLDLLPFVLRPVTWIALVIVIALGVMLFFGRSRIRKLDLRQVGMFVSVIMLITAVIVGWLASHVPSLAVSGEQSGAFFSIVEYCRWSLPLLVLGLGGLFLSFKKRLDDPWQWAALVSLCAVASSFFFYRRFILPLDFFLLPFAAASITQLFFHRKTIGKILLTVLLLVQAGLLGWQMALVDPHVEASTLASIKLLRSVVPASSTVVVLDNMAPWVVGYLPTSAVSGPGIFDSKPLQDWQKLIYGSDQERRAFIASYPKGTFFLATDVFNAFYPPEAQLLLSHSCLVETGLPGLYTSTCGQ